jgi:hypothetical protein
MAALHLAPGLSLDPDYVGGGTFGVIAKRGAGKSYLGRVLAEEFWQAGVPFVVLDPMGMWWGLRASADGKDIGIPVAIFGGDHGDAPLERTGGALLADLIVDEGLSAILDMSALGSRAAERQFALDFLDRLYRRHGGTGRLLHILIDEADLFAPQKPQAGDQPLLGATENLVRRGRNRGLAVTLITQRSAVLNKDVLTQVDGLIAGRVLSPQDRDAVDAWTRVHGDPDTAATVRGSLHELDTGEWWFWVPELDVLKRVKVRRSRTFDCSPTRKRSGQRAEPKTFADVDMAAIQQRMTATIERAQAEDPKTLRRRIKELTAELEDRPPAETVEVPVLTDDARAALLGAADAIDQAQQTMVDAVAAASKQLNGVLDRLGSRAAATPPPARPPARPPTAPPARRTVPAADAVAAERVPLRAGALRMLRAVASLHPMPLTKAKVGTLAKVKSSGGTFSTYLGELKRAGYLEENGGELTVTQAGFDALGTDPPAPATADEVRALWRDRLRAGARRMLDALIDRYPEGLTREELAESAEVVATGGTFSTYLGDLRRAGLAVEVDGVVHADEVLFIGSTR